MDTLRIIAPDKIVWLNLTGSGNETAAHIIKHNRMTILFCAFEGNPMILRLYGTAGIHHRQDEAYYKYIDLFPEIAGSRQIIEMNIEMVQTSCGFGVPLMDFREERTQLRSWAEEKGEEALEKYRQEKNAFSIDNFETGILRD